MTYQTRKNYFFNPSGISLIYRLYVPSEPRAVLVVTHGFGEYSGRYKYFVDYFTGKGFVVATFDHPGHGESEGRRGDVTEFDQWVKNLKTFIGKIRSELPGDLPMIVVGHSVGGLVALHCATEKVEGIKATVVSAPALKLSVSSLKAWSGYLASFLFPGAYVPMGLDPKYISGVEKSVSDYANNPLIIRRLTFRTWRAMMKFISATRKIATRVQGPILMLHQKGDRICMAEETKAFFDQIGDSKKKFLLYDGEFHESFNDVIRDDVFNDIYRWLDDVLFT